MMFPELSRLSLTAAGAVEGMVILCADARLARALRQAHARQQGDGSWRALAVATPAQWLDHLTSAALLRGELPPAALPGVFLNRAEEQVLWQQAVAEDSGAAEDASTLFDVQALARHALEADGLLRRWPVAIPEGWPDPEYQAFRRWRDSVTERCRASGWCGETEAMAWRIGCVERGVGGLPPAVAVAGFTAPDPLLTRLLAALAARGVRCSVLAPEGESRPRIAVHDAADSRAECRAAAAWAKDRLARQPGALLRIAVADLASSRERLARELDAALHPGLVGPVSASAERCWGFVSPQVLVDHDLVELGISLLHVAIAPQRLSQAGFGELLRRPGWSDDVAEADARARFEFFLRERLPPEASLARFRRQLEKSDLAGELPALCSTLGALADFAARGPRRRAPGVWGAAFRGLLAAVGWPGRRILTVADTAAVTNWSAVLDGLGRFDAVCGRIDATAALALARDAARGAGNDVPRSRIPQIEVCSCEEAGATPVDALWVMGLSEDAWPSPAQPNPLLPAERQRAAGVTAAAAATQYAMAALIEHSWLDAAAEVVLSWPGQRGDRILRPARIAGTAGAPADSVPVPVSLAFETLTRIDDDRAPPVEEGETVRGGTWLLRAQAICPAWAYYQFRLAAAVPPLPTLGLDARGRGSLLHSALEHFWRGRGQADLGRFDAAGCAAAVAAAVEAALTDYDAAAPEPLPPRFRQLERERLEILLQGWLPLELARAPFTVLAVEERHELTIEGLPVRVVVDRVDRLDADGRIVVIDYKSGRSASARSWAAARIDEPQLPIYAALVFPDRDVAAVALARVTPSDPGFIGVAATDGVLPGVAALDTARRDYPEARFPDWASVRRHWASALQGVAAEVRAGCAAVRVADERKLDYCDVRPLLRLDERRRQWEEGMDRR